MLLPKPPTADELDEICEQAKGIIERESGGRFDENMQIMFFAGVKIGIALYLQRVAEAAHVALAKTQPQKKGN